MELPLTWDLNLENYAKWWASSRREDCRLMHSFPEGDFKLGENIYWGSGNTWTPTDAVNAWADEKKYYDYASNSCVEGQLCGHYTQIVWKTTRRVGCARVICDSGDVFMTCNYDPPGNYIVRATKMELPLTWDSNLENYAKWWASQRREVRRLMHSFPESDFKLGENISWGSGNTWTPTHVANAWADEKKYYDYASNSCVEGQLCGDYTQNVWKSTRRVGCARVIRNSGDVFMTCN
ncbi:hypothetical protein RND71_005193 [Anisodus tanguticus]|uniref:SCP domain-containing protein n=1 Tax=Anisodus tanguticus TaxID=243964 RepID=A0AAE1VS35_9SOLA|nr:hypothetical protein RND71_005193 [Anisodus tanguticus]